MAGKKEEMGTAGSHLVEACKQHHMKGSVLELPGEKKTLHPPPLPRRSWRRDLESEIQGLGLSWTEIVRKQDFVFNTMLMVVPLIHKIQAFYFIVFNQMALFHMEQL